MREENVSRTGVVIPKLKLEEKSEGSFTRRNQTTRMGNGGDFMTNRSELHRKEMDDDDDNDRIFVNSRASNIDDGEWVADSFRAPRGERGPHNVSNMSNHSGTTSKMTS